jgi:hypothetical protein
MVNRARRNVVKAPLTLAFLAAAAVLNACAAPRSGEAPAPPPERVQDACRSAIQPAWSVRRRVVHLASCEWTAFGRQRLLLYATGASEIQVAFGPDEDALSVWPRVGEYWDSADPRHAAAVRAAAARTGDRELWPAWRRAWSAAFISWVMREAGAPGFAPNPAHARYLEAALGRDPGSVVEIGGYAPQPGDLVCAGRGSGPRDSAEFMGRLRQRSGYFPSHCDVIVEVGPDQAVLIGGNVKNGVTATATPLQDGRFVPTPTRPWAVAYILRDGADPCATLSPGPACWNAEGARSFDPAPPEPD